MKTGFKNKLEIKNTKTMTSPWNYDQPVYDERTSCYVNAGSHSGVGHRQPVGHKGDPKMRVDTLPYGKVNTLKDDTESLSNEPIEFRK
jgi:hypothetical protein